MDKPIPAFYCCYLLRSIVRHAALYVGSTPNPPRRLKQHNGVSKGGAVRTSRDSLRPWEMVCIVTGFPSKIAALQFEWAWQNTHMTRHIAPEERITERRTKVRISPRSGKFRKRPMRPRISLTDKMSNLHILLRANSFERWPLEVRFFDESVFKVWQLWGGSMGSKIREGITVSVQPTEKRKPNTENPDTPPAPQGAAAIDATYASWKPHLEKSRILLLPDRSIPCNICKQTLNTEKTLVLVCPNDGCETAAHLSCMSKHFLAKEGLEVVVPTAGECPGCKMKLNWQDLVRDLSLRTRGQKEVEALVKKPRQRKAKAPKKTKGKAGAEEADIVAADEANDVEMDDQETTEISLDAEADENDALEDDWKQDVVDETAPVDGDVWDDIDQVLGRSSQKHEKPSQDEWDDIDRVLGKMPSTQRRSKKKVAVLLEGSDIEMR